MFWSLRDWAAYAPAVSEKLAEMVTDLNSPPVWKSAGAALLDIAGSDQPHPAGGAAPGSVLHDVVARLLAQMASDDPEGGDLVDCDPDLPARRRLERLLGERGTLEHGLRAPLARQLSAEPRLTGLRLSLLVRTVDPDASQAALTAACRELIAAVADRPVPAGRCADQLYQHLRYRNHTLAHPEQTLAAIRALAAGGGLAEGLCAAALVAALGPCMRWPGPWKAYVRSLRRYPDAEVREAAYAIDLSSS